SGALRSARSQERVRGLGSPADMYDDALALTRSGGYWSRVLNDFSATNSMILGRLAPPGTGFATGASGTVGGALGYPTAMDVADSVVLGVAAGNITGSGWMAGAGLGFAEAGGWTAVGQATVVTGVSYAGVGFFYEVGVFAGSMFTGALP
ncbi:MAG: hypothetical protein ACREJ3_16255, partial [Polyangiaceae bacterium]